MRSEEMFRRRLKRPYAARLRPRRVCVARLCRALHVARPAWGADVVSSNIVGYEKLSLTANSFIMSAVQFVSVGGNAGTMSDLFTATDIPYGSEARFVGDDGNYEFLEYVDEAYDEPNDDFVPGWADRDGYLITDVKTPGTGFWVKASEDYDLVQSGQVVDTASATVTIPAGMFVMASNPYPVAFNPNATTVNWGSNLAYGTELRVLNASGQYVFYEYVDEAYDEPNDDFVPGWADRDGYLVNGDIADVGQGFWIKSENAITITFTSPASTAE